MFLVVLIMHICSVQEEKIFLTFFVP